MPYNTRRKSLSLPMLGIQLPNSSRSSSHRSPPSSNTPQSDQPPQKKIKRVHAASTASSSSPLSPSVSKLPKNASRVVENTPPPSPRADGQVKVDTEGINDDIVVAVIQQLEETGNRPHLLKELAAVLATQLPIVESSANPSAIISSRLTAYIRRPWTALAPCPVGKELVGTHPKRIYFFLTTSPHQPIPEPAESSTAAPARIISPSLSSAADDSEEEERDARTRSAMSPSPEVDLSSPELDDEGSETSTTFSGRSSLLRDGPHPATTSNMAHNRRAASPPLERDEREFTATASSLQQRSRSQESETKPAVFSVPMDTHAEDAAGEESEESAAQRNSEAAALLFGQSVESNTSSAASASAAMDFGMASPVLRPLQSVEDRKRNLDSMEDVRVLDADDAGLGWAWDQWKSPEHVELDELDDLLGDY
ncbi:uncharacterized protein K452DRAFT_303170 [Aplosporella prunicola CBS 121167]|uniref:GDS1 winged helix domain-containing protein n=1 Tax=Aplosporella prunicola CBS 121167 TaxID=1176127 RepID=A0A6A6AWF2_9PEZI|nr:uncharacterized protein K452DRAFT_303170 [Aplosporella prunicola CBS 121167]KAF2135926.1 hypothetical protein K452DRAFT_303170 [Aplosporella prunicola CBS 121167]